MRIIRRLRSLSLSLRIPRPKIRITMSKRWRIYALVYLIETMVVMIGVAAGFWLNSWSEANKEKKMIGEYMKNLNSDLENDINNLQNNDSITLQKINTLVQLLGLLKTNDYEQMEMIDSLVKKTFENVIFFYPSKTTYESIKQGGQISVIKDVKLKNDLIYLYDFQYEQIKINENLILEVVRNNIEPFIIQNYDMIEFRAINKEPIFSYQFANLIQQLISDLSNNLTYYKEAFAKCEEIKTRVKQLTI
jgi:hypothetical protein